MNIDWIAFDAVGTLIRPEPAVGEIYHRVAQRHGSRLTLAEITARFKQAFHDSEVGWAVPTASSPNGGHSPPYELTTSEELERERWLRIVKQVIDDVPDATPCFHELYAHFARPESWRCFADVGPALTRLKSAGYRIAVASNFDHRLHAVCDGMPELRDIECRVISALVGYRKPSRGFFNALLAATRCAPDHILMVGDDHENDILGARRAGMQAVFLDRRDGQCDEGISSLERLLK